MNAKNNSKVTVDYPDITDMRSARAFAVKVGRTFKASDSRLTVQATIATREALRTGFLRDGRGADDSPIPTVSNGGFASMFGVTGGLVTRWRSLAAAWDAGVTPDDLRWTMLTGGAVRKAEVRKACLTRKAAAIDSALVADGYDLKTGVRTAPEGKARKTAAEKTDKVDEKDAVPISKVSAKDAEAVAREAARVLSLALKAMPVTSGKAETYTAIRSGLLALIRDEDKRRNVATIPTPATVAARKSA